jgi:hypothetical protein
LTHFYAKRPVTCQIAEKTQAFIRQKIEMLAILYGTPQQLNGLT